MAFFRILAILLLLGATAAAPRRDWTKAVAVTPEGGFVMGNPAAKVELVEYASLTCPHCAAFHQGAMASLKKNYVAHGRVSYEYRSLILNGPDAAAALLARCDGAARFFPRADALYAQQPVWVAGFGKIAATDRERIAALAPEAAIPELADAGGLDDFMAALGMPKPRFLQCVRDKAALERLAAIRARAGARGVTGTPTFLINSEVVPSTIRWDQLEPALKAALAK